MKKLFLILILFLSLSFTSKAQLQSKDTVDFIIELSKIVSSDTTQIVFIWSSPDLIEKGYIARKGYLVTSNVVVCDTMIEIKKIYTCNWAAVDMKKVKKITIGTWKN